MESSELLKLVLSGDFVVASIVRDRSGLYIIKRLQQTGYPTWVVVAKCKNKDAALFELELLSKTKPFIYIRKAKPTLDDLLNFSNAGFKVIRKSKERPFTIKRFNPETKHWGLFKTFPTASARRFYISMNENIDRFLVV